jgi:protein phosphatase
MVRRRELSKEQAKKHPQRSILYRALGVGPEVEVDVIPNLTLRADEYYLLCSDGLYNNVEDQEMQRLVIANPPSAACKALVDLSNDRGGQDNITVQVVHLEGSPSVLDGVKRLLGR